MGRFNLSQPIPLLLVGDGADSHTGLGRIGHDLAWILSTMPEFKVGYLGRNSLGRAKFPWASYTFGPSDNWGEYKIQEAWQDLSAGVHGIVFTVWDASRLLWFVHPEGYPPKLQEFLLQGNFERWGYFMADAAGVDPGRLPLEQAEVMRSYDRVLVASRWAHGLAVASGVGEVADLDWMPHPINRASFRRHPRETARSFWGVDARTPLLHCVMANQARKHWPVVMETLALLPQARLWLHTDLALHYWNLQALAVEYGVGDRIISEGRPLADTELAMRYSACDAGLVISGGEGFGYPVAESLSCGVPVVTGSYGAAAELTDARCLVQAAWSAVDTVHNVRRAGYRAQDVAERVRWVLGQEWIDESGCAGDPQRLVEHLDSPLLAVQWRRWLRKGLQ